MSRFIFPVILVALEAGAGAVYYWEGDWRRGSYWALGALMTVFVTVE
jgi:hypothetical protein